MTKQGDPEAQRYNPQIPHDPTHAQPDRYGVDPSYHYSSPPPGSQPHPQYPPSHVPTPPPGGPGHLFPNPFTDPFATPNSQLSGLNEYEFASQADPYARPYSTHPSEGGHTTGGGFTAPPPPPPVIPEHPGSPYMQHHATGDSTTGGFTSPRPPVDDHYLDPAYDPHPPTRYQLDDDGAIPQDHEDTGGIPLLARHGSGPGSVQMPMPGGYTEGGQGGNEDDNFIHYGRIPQRVPRRFKTTKKVQCVSFFYLLFLRSSSILREEREADANGTLRIGCIMEISSWTVPSHLNFSICVR